jgi:hypothetical protein
MTCRFHARLAAALSLGAWLLSGATAAAQSEHQHQPPQGEEARAWKWSWDANVFVGWNYQYRKFRDFQEIESQNWLMGATERPLGSANVRFHTMLSLEPFTMQALGSPQVFQTGETYQQAPLIDYQHPHDLFMDVGATWTRPTRDGRVFATLALVGAPAIGPEAFMHRASAAGNPTAPLSHHQLDASHISHGVATAGLVSRSLTIEGSVFHGAEPDENRKDIELGPLDSWAVRGRWNRRGWEAQVSGAYLTTPEWVEPFSDVVRLTASIGFTSADGRLAGLAAWGQNREVHGNLDGYLVEGTARPRPRQAVYARAELATKDILGAGGRHPPGFTHFHPLSRVGAFTLGYIYDIAESRAGRFGIGGDVTVYYVPPNLENNYGRPASFHVFLRYRPNKVAAHVH